MEYKFDHNVRLDQVQDLLNKRTEEGWSLVEFLVPTSGCCVLFQRKKKDVRSYLSDYDILLNEGYDEDEAKEMIARRKVQRLEELKLQVMAQNPQLLGIGMPGMDNFGQAPGC